MSWFVTISVLLCWSPLLLKWWEAWDYSSKPFLFESDSGTDTADSFGVNDIAASKADTWNAPYATSWLEFNVTFNFFESITYFGLEQNFTRWAGD